MMRWHGEFLVAKNEELNLGLPKNGFKFEYLFGCGIGFAVLAERLETLSDIHDLPAAEV